jgi:hypothetical protein
VLASVLQPASPGAEPEKELAQRRAASKVPKRGLVVIQHRLRPCCRPVLALLGPEALVRQTLSHHASVHTARVGVELRVQVALATLHASTHFGGRSTRAHERRD